MCCQTNNHTVVACIWGYVLSEGLLSFYKCLKQLTDNNNSSVSNICKLLTWIWCKNKKTMTNKLRLSYVPINCLLFWTHNFSSTFSKMTGSSEKLTLKVPFNNIIFFPIQLGLPSRQFTWNVKSYSLWKISISVLIQIYLALLRINLLCSEEGVWNIFISIMNENQILCKWVNACIANLSPKIQKVNLNLRNDCKPGPWFCVI